MHKRALLNDIKFLRKKGVNYWPAVKFEKGGVWHLSRTKAQKVACDYEKTHNHYNIAAWNNKLSLNTPHLCPLCANSFVNKIIEYEQKQK